MFRFFNPWSKSYTPGLPPELWLQIFHYLSLYDLASIMQVNRFFLPLAQSDEIFKHKISQYFPSAARDEGETLYDVFADKYCDEFGPLKSKETRQLLAFIYEKQWDRIATLQFRPEQLYEKDANNVSILTHIHRQNSQTLKDIVFKQVRWQGVDYYLIDDETFKLAVACNQINMVMNYNPSSYVWRMQDGKKFVLSFLEFLHICVKFNLADIFIYLWDILLQSQDIGECTIERSDRYFPEYKFISTAAKYNSTNIIHLLASRRLRDDPLLQHFDEERSQIKEAFGIACYLGNYDAFVTLSLYFPSILEECVFHGTELGSVIRQDREDILKYICSRVDVRNVVLTGVERDFLDIALSINYLGGIKCLLEHGAKPSDFLLQTLNQYNLQGTESVLRPDAPTAEIQPLIDFFELLNQYQPQQAPGMRPR